VKLKLDENLGQSVATALAGRGLDVATVPEQQLAGVTDNQIFEVCGREERVLVTLDLDFANPFRFDPTGGPGIAVLRVRTRPGLPELIDTALTLAEHLKRSPIAGRLWIVEPGRVRRYESDEPPGDDA